VVRGFLRPRLPSRPRFAPLGEWTSHPHQPMTQPSDTSAGMPEAERLAREHLRIVAEGDEDAVAANVTPDYFNHRSADEPMATRQRGPVAVIATIRWLHRAFTDMRFEVHDVALKDNVVALHVTLHARQHGRFVVHDSPDGTVTDVFPSTGRSFAARQTHWITIHKGAVAVHDAVRDDLGMAKQLGWIPPKPIYVARMLWARRQERRAARQMGIA
jgi:hypothetical protein